MNKDLVRESIEKLRAIRQDYETGKIDMVTANQQGKDFVQIYNNKAKEVAKKYKVNPKLLPNNVKYYPN